MKGGYYNQWHRRNTRPASPPHDDNAVARSAAMEEQLHRCQAAVDTLGDRIARADDGDGAAVRFDRLADRVQDEDVSPHASSQNVTELRSRTKRLEGVLRKLISDVEGVKAGRTADVRTQADAMSRTEVNCLVNESLQDLQGDIDARLHSLQVDLRSDIKSHVAAVAGGLREEIQDAVVEIGDVRAQVLGEIRTLREVQAAHGEELGSLGKRVGAVAGDVKAFAARMDQLARELHDTMPAAGKADTVDTKEFKSFQRTLVGNLSTLQAYCKRFDGEVSEVRNACKAVQKDIDAVAAHVGRVEQEALAAHDAQRRALGDMEESMRRTHTADPQAGTHSAALEALVAQLRGELRDGDARCTQLASEVDVLKGDFGEQVLAFRNHLQGQTARAADTSAAIQQLIDMNDTSRAAITSEITTVKDWTMRCLQRLRKRTEVAVQDARIIKDECADLVGKVTRAHVGNERQAQLMSELLQQQTEKTLVLHGMLDKEIDARRTAPTTPQRSPARREGGGAVDADIAVKAEELDRLIRTMREVTGRQQQEVHESCSEGEGTPSRRKQRERTRAVQKVGSASDRDGGESGGHGTLEAVTERVKRLNERYQHAKARARSSHRRLAGGRDGEGEARHVSPRRSPPRGRRTAVRSRGHDYGTD